jgi:hypothetical protein
MLDMFLWSHFCVSSLLLDLLRWLHYVNPGGYIHEVITLWIKTVDLASGFVLNMTSYSFSLCYTTTKVMLNLVYFPSTMCSIYGTSVLRMLNLVYFPSTVCSIYGTSVLWNDNDYSLGYRAFLFSIYFSYRLAYI